MSELKPCPFCKSDDTMMACPKPEKFWVWCYSCRAEGPIADTRQKAIEAWNTRAEYHSEPHRSGDDASCPMVDLDDNDWESIKQAALESKWMPSQYMQNDWVSDVCNFLRSGPESQQGPSDGALLLAIAHFGWTVKPAYEGRLWQVWNKQRKIEGESETLRGALEAALMGKPAIRAAMNREQPRKQPAICEHCGTAGKPGYICRKCKKPLPCKTEEKR